MIIAEVSVVPVGAGTSVSKYVREGIRALESSGLRTQTNAMATDIEAKSIDEIFAAVKSAHLAVLGAGAQRVLTTLKIDDRIDKEATMESKVNAVR
ncbi:MAG: MTH1187 family thiamine-binding protein [Candidatus Thermoplasmatota archaeon]|nr:MTH1187 family thiamine-binding protein [Candidatus Thermoplasmatota archaeon]